jgi:hypothetical protein
MEQDYPWLDGYVFLHGGKAWKAVCEMWSKEEIRYMGRLERDDGDDPDRIIVFVEVYKDEKDAEAKLNAKIKAVTDKANPSFSTAKSDKIGISGPTRWSKKKPWGAFLRLKAERGQKTSLFQSLYPAKDGGMVPTEAYYGHASCTGDWDVFLELGAESKKELTPLIELVQGMNGVESSIVSRQQNSIYKPSPPAQGTCKEWRDDSTEM